MTYHEFVKKFTKNLAERIRIRKASSYTDKDAESLAKMNDDELIIKYGTEKELDLYYKLHKDVYYEA